MICSINCSFCIFTEVQDQLVSVQRIFATRGAFAAVDTKGQVVVWGQRDCGGPGGTGDGGDVIHCWCDVRYIERVRLANS